MIPDRVSLPTPPPSNPSTPSSRKRKAFTTDDEEPPSSQSSISSSSSYRSSPSSRMKGEDLFNARVFQSAEATTMFYQFITTFREKIRQEVKQTSPTHKFIRTLRDGGRLMRCYTQNIDGLEAREGLCVDLKRGRGNKRRFMKKNYEVPRPVVTENTDFDAGCEIVQLHGELSRLRCRVCSTETNWSDEATDIYVDGGAPECEECALKSDLRLATGKRGLAVGELRPNIVLYGEDHPHNVLLTPIIAFDQACNPDLLIIMGTSLKVHGLQKIVRDFARIVHTQKNGRVVFVNRTKPSESQWEGVIDDYIAMDCDDWIIDLKGRRDDLWLHQGELGLKVKKVTSQKRKRKADDPMEKENFSPSKRSKIEVRIPTLQKQSPKRDQSHILSEKNLSAHTKTPRSRAQTGWKNRPMATTAISNLLSPLVRQRPQFSPLHKHFKPLIREQNGSDFVPGSPLSPSISSICTAGTHGSRSQKNECLEAVTPTPRQNARASRTARSKLAIFEDIENDRSPVPDNANEVEAEEGMEETQCCLLSSPTRQPSFISSSIDGEVDRPLESNSRSSKNLLQRLYHSMTRIK